MRGVSLVKQITDTQKKVKKSGLRGTLKVSSLDIQIKQSGYNSKVVSSDYFYLELLNQPNTANIQIHYLAFSINIYIVQHVFRFITWIFSIHIIQPIFRFNHSQQNHLPSFISFSLIIIHYKKNIMFLKIPPPHNWSIHLSRGVSRIFSNRKNHSIRKEKSPLERGH